MKTIKKFKPKAGQTDFSKIRWAPVVNCVLQYRGKILLVQPNPKMRLYPGYWNGISGFLDDNQSLKDKVKQEVKEEAGITERQILSIRLGSIFHQEESKYKKTWIVHPVLVKVSTNRVKLDWEATNYQWIKPAQTTKLNLLPGFVQVLKALSLM